MGAHDARSGGAVGTTTRTTWRIAGEELGSCNCAWGCPCQFNALPTRGFCQGVAVCAIREGRFGDIRLDGVRFAILLSFPGAVHEGNGSRQLIVDEGAAPEQREALIALATGAHGGLLFEIFAAVAPDVREPLSLPIRLAVDRERRTGVVEIPGIAEIRAEPIRNPVTGEEHRARIVLPEGFEFKEAEVGNSTRLSVTSAAPLSYAYEDTYAQFNAFDWSSDPAPLQTSRKGG
jgi:hypothetical protein